MLLTLQCQALCTLLPFNSSISAGPGELRASEWIQGNFKLKLLTQ
jgi:hypothetical protein